MKKKTNYKRMTSMPETPKKELKAVWVAFKQVVIILAPFTVVDVITAAELENGSSLPGWLWGLEILAIACLLYAIQRTPLAWIVRPCAGSTAAR